MWHSVKGVVLALALSATAATAQLLPVPRQPPGGACPLRLERHVLLIA